MSIGRVVIRNREARRVRIGSRPTSLRCLWFIALLLAACFTTISQPVLSQEIPGYRHKHWDVAEGAPADIRAIAQTPDGFLWLGASNGLYRFDGFSFERINPPANSRLWSNQITALVTAADGSLWVGHDFGGVAVYRDGRLANANADKRVRPMGSVQAMAAAPNGDIWVAVNGRLGAELRLFRAGRWQSFTSRDVLAPEPIQNLFVDRDQALWIAQLPALLRLRPGSTRPERVPASINMGATFADTRSGVLWMASDSGIQQPDDSKSPTPLVSKGLAGGSLGARSMLFEGDEAWIAGQQEGVLRLTGLQGPAPRTSILPVRSRILFRDREGTIWGGGPDGLVNYIRSPAVRMQIVGVPSVGLVREARPPHALFGGANDQFYRITNRSAEILKTGRVPTMLCAAPDGGILYYATNSLRLWKDGVDHALPAPEQPYAPTGCAYLSANRAVVAFTRMYELQGSTWRRRDDWPVGGAVLADGKGGFYVNQPLRALLHIGPNRVRTLWQGDDILIGFIRMMKQDGPYLYLGGEHGLARYDGREFRTLDAGRHPYLSGLTGLAFDQRYAWLIGGNGIVMIERIALDRAFARPDAPLPHQPIARAQGLIARTSAFAADDAAVDGDGAPWFVTNRGLVRIDLTHTGANSTPPPVVIRSITADGIGRRLRDLRLPAGTARVDFDYIALSLTDPLLNRYRYRLQGFDANWVQAGGRREASYTGLAPGRYVFQVIGANPDGVWNERGATATIEIAPFFWQTWWFRAVVVLGGAISLWLTVRWRIRTASEAVRQRLEDREAVREHIAQELHDTLLQGVQGLMLRFQAILAHLPPGDRARVELETTLERADDVLQEGRDRVRFLREQAEPMALAPLLKKVAQDTLQDNIAWSVKEIGEGRPICAPVADDLARIAGEALFNTLRHAQAQRVTIEITYRADALSVAIADDGIGIDPAIRQAGRKAGHYGLVGMRERAQRLGTTLRITNVSPSGTEVTITVPGRIAYR